MLDHEGGEMALFYSDIVEWNAPPQEWQKGSLDNVLRDFTPSSYMQSSFSSSFVDGLRFELSGGALGAIRTWFCLPVKVRE